MHQYVRWNCGFHPKGLQLDTRPVEEELVRTKVFFFVSKKPSLHGEKWNTNVGIKRQARVWGKEMQEGMIMDKTIHKWRMLQKDFFR